MLSEDFNYLRDTNEGDEVYHSITPKIITTNETSDRYDISSLFTESTYESDIVGDAIREYQRQQEMLEMDEQNKKTTIQCHMQFDKIDKLVIMRGNEMKEYEKDDKPEENKSEVTDFSSNKSIIHTKFHTIEYFRMHKKKLLIVSLLVFFAIAIGLSVYFVIFQSFYEDKDLIKETTTLKIDPSEVIKSTCKCSFDGSDYICQIKNVTSIKPDLLLMLTEVQHERNQTDNDVKKFKIQHETMLHFPDMSRLAERFPNVEDLRIFECGLKFIENSRLGVFSNLKVLDFYKNAIELIPENIFDELQFLRGVKFSQNKITKLPENLFKNQVDLRYFFCSVNEIETLPKNLFENTIKLNSVSFRENKLKFIHVDFSKLTYLAHTDLRANSCIDSCFDLGSYCNATIPVKTFQDQINENCN